MQDTDITDAPVCDAHRLAHLSHFLIQRSPSATLKQTFSQSGQDVKLFPASLPVKTEPESNLAPGRQVQYLWAGALTKPDQHLTRPVKSGQQQR